MLRDELNDIRWFEELDSTSSYARRMVDKRELLPPVTIAAKRQTAGRGRGSNQWWSPDGCLMFSTLLDSRQYNSDTGSLPQAALAIGVAIAAELSKYVDTEDVQLKWPNDVYLRGRKVAGILVEGLTSPNETSAHPAQQSLQSGLWWIIGVGLNLSINWENAPTEVRERATCLASESGITFEAEAFLPGLVQSIHQHLSIWGANNALILEEFRRFCFLRDKMVEIQQGATAYTGLCQSIDQEGRLLLATENRLLTISAGSVRLL